MKTIKGNKTKSIWFLNSNLIPWKVGMLHCFLCCMEIDIWKQLIYYNHTHICLKVFSEYTFIVLFYHIIICFIIAISIVVHVLWYFLVKWFIIYSGEQGLTANEHQVNGAKRMKRIQLENQEHGLGRRQENKMCGPRQTETRYVFNVTCHTHKNSFRNIILLQLQFFSTSSFFFTISSMLWTQSVNCEHEIVNCEIRNTAPNANCLLYPLSSMIRLL